MKIALDPYMIRHEPLDRLPHAVAELGYDQIELSPRSDFLDWWVMPRATRERMAAFRQRSEEHTSELQSPCNLVCRLLLEKKKNKCHRCRVNLTSYMFRV